MCSQHTSGSSCLPDRNQSAVFHVQALYEHCMCVPVFRVNAVRFTFKSWACLDAQGEEELLTDGEADLGGRGQNLRTQEGKGR